MVDHQRILQNIERCSDPEKLRTWITNLRNAGANEIAEAAFRRLVFLLPKEKPGTVEHDFWQMIHAFEHVLSEENGKTTRLSRTRQKVDRVGEVQTLKDWALNTENTRGFNMLLERNMAELTGEAIVLRHADSFPNEVIVGARSRLEAAGVDVGALPRRSEI